MAGAEEEPVGGEGRSVRKTQDQLGRMRLDGADLDTLTYLDLVFDLSLEPRRGPGAHGPRGDPVAHRPRERGVQIGT